MTTYEMNIDTLNSSLSYYQAEKYIYGSSRLGMLKDSVNVLGSAFTDTDTTNITHTLGNKRYELSNHLGNVLAVITNKPIPHNNGGTVDYWQASIASAYDYSPFGVMLTGRTFEGKQTICHDSITNATQKPLEEGFSSWGSWTTMGNGLVTYVSGEMQVSNPNSSKKDIGASKAFTTGTGVHNVSFKVIGNTCATVVIWPPSSTPIPISVSVKDNYGNVVASGNYTTAGTYNLSFTPASAGANYTLEFHMTKASAFCFFRVDDVLVSYDDTSTVTVCKEVENSYLYGYQGQLRDDEIKGRGNSYNYTYRMHDTRLGRFFAVDPLSAKYPWNSPYVFSENVVINAVEFEGLERNYVFNSAYLSAKALTAIQTQTYSEVKQYLDNLVGTRFDSYENLEYAKRKLGENFDDAAGYASDGVTGLSSGNRAVRGNYQSKESTADYFYIRLVIDNGNGTWSTQDALVRDPKHIQNKLNELDNKINNLKKYLNKLQHDIKVDEWWTSTPTDKLINTSDRDGRADAYFNLGQELAKSQTRKLLPEKRQKASNIEAKIVSLKTERYKLSKTPLVKMGKAEPVSQ